jgi:hypothetical protein
MVRVRVRVRVRVQGSARGEARLLARVVLVGVPDQRSLLVGRLVRVRVGLG